MNKPIIRKYRKTVSRKRSALNVLGWLVLVCLLCSLLNIRNLTQAQARRDAEVEKGWGSLQLIWEQKMEYSHGGLRKGQLYVSGESYIFVEMRWSLLKGWICYPMTVIEPQADQPVQAGINSISANDTVYIVGYITQEQVEIEDITFRAQRTETGTNIYEWKEEITLRPEDCFYYDGKTFFVRPYVLQSPMYGDEASHWDIYIRVIDEDGTPILWDDGPYYEEGDWVRVIPIHSLER